MPRTILLADDSVTIRKVVELTFSETDIRVEAVGTGREALERLRDLRPDLVLADVVMPGPSGYEICRVVKSSSRPVPVLLLAGTFEPFDPELARAAGCDGHVIKPFDSRTLVERVEALLAPAKPHRPARPTPVDDDVERIFDDLAAPREVTTPEPTARTVRVSPEPADGLELETLTRTAAAEAGAPAAAVASAPTLRPADIDAIARAVVGHLSEAVLREIAWEGVPDTAEMVVRERLRELEGEERGKD